MGALVAALPEIYQPIYGHPECSMKTSRKCEDRLGHIIAIYTLFAQKLGRPLRVLDLGCAQGFFSLHLAALGATVNGVDFLQPNIDVCNELALENPELKLRFIAARVEAVIDIINAGQFDLVLGLSVFHHIIHIRGLDAVQSLFTKLAHSVAVGLYELALPSEPPDWAPSQPEDPRQQLEPYAFVHEIAQSETHLSSITRPLYVASNHYWFLSDQIGQFDRYQKSSHVFSVDALYGTRRYFFGEGKVIKVFRVDHPLTFETNQREYSNESLLLSLGQSQLKFPRLYLHGRHVNEAWLVRECLEGELLLKYLDENKPYDAHKIIRDVLTQLAALETFKLYHVDVRIWNILLTPDNRAQLIDYGAIDHNARDCTWPENVYLSFMIFVREVLQRKAPKFRLLEASAMNPDELPEPYRSAFWQMLCSDPTSWSYAQLLKQLSQNGQIQPYPSPIARNGLAYAFERMGAALKIYQENTEQTIVAAMEEKQQTDLTAAYLKKAVGEK